MPYIPQIKIGSTTYDVKDMEAREKIVDANNKINENETSLVYKMNDSFKLSDYDLEFGYINSSTGEIVLSNLNVVMKNILRFGRGTTLYFAEGYVVTIGYYHEDLSFDRIGYPTYRSFTFTEDCFVRITMRSNPAVVITDKNAVANNMTIYATSGLPGVKELDILKNDSELNEKDYTILKPIWKQGYRNTSGEEVVNYMNMETVDILFMPAGSKYVTDGHVASAAHFYDENGTWQRYNVISANEQYTFTEDSYVRFGVFFGDLRNFYDPNIPNQHVTIFKHDTYSKANILMQNLQGKPAKAHFEWEYGYVNNNGVDVFGSNLNVRTVGKLSVAKGTSISIPTGITMSIHYYDNSGNWVSYEMHNGPYAKSFTENKNIIVSARYTNPVSIISVSDVANLVKINLMMPIDGINAEEHYWEGKKIVWFGTSIPAGVVNAGDSGGNGAYPTRIGDLLGATVYNESIGTSEVRAGTHGSYVTSDDPMGYGGVSGPGLMYSLSLSSSEKQEIYDDWETKWKYIITWYNDLIDMSNIANYKNSSWDVKLAKYLTGGSVGPCDLYVFDHGYNDRDRAAQFTELDDIPEDPNDRRYWFGAMSFLFSKIYADNPKARIVIVGHYSTNQWDGDSCTKYVCEAQEKLAKYWSIPIIKTWEHMGFSFMEITEGGNTFIPAQSWLPDLIHPAADSTGKSLQHYANVLYPLMRDLR